MIGRDSLTTEFLTATARPARLVGLEPERALRTAAATLRAGACWDVSAVSVLLALGLDDLDGLTELVSHIADEFGLLASLRPMVGACTVRFSRREPGRDEPDDKRVSAALARFFEPVPGARRGPD